MEERGVAFTKYYEAFKQLDNNTKKKEIIESFQELIDYLDELCFNEDKNIEYLKELRDMGTNDGDMNDNDFLNASIVYLESAKDMLGQYLREIDE